jgi:hypothetical protein
LNIKTNNIKKWEISIFQNNKEYEDGKLGKINLIFFEQILKSKMEKKERKNQDKN